MLGGLMAKTPANVLAPIPISHYGEKARYPPLYAWIDRHLELTPETSSQSIDEVRAVFDAAAEVVDERRADPAGVHARAMFRDDRR
jgi:hypothetical protein